MAGIGERVKQFLKGWPIAKRQLEEIVREGKENEGNAEESA